MNTKRTVFWIVFLIVIALIIWGLFEAMKKGQSNSLGVPGGTPAPVTSADHVTGNPDAPVTLIEYGDFECPACGEYAPVIEQLINTDASTTLRVVFRHFPLPQHLNAPIAAQASEAASDQGKFWDMYKLLYAGQNSWADLSQSQAKTVFDGYAEQLGLDVPLFDKDMTSTTTLSTIQSDLAEGQSLGIDYTPTFFLNGRAIQNPQSYADFQSIIQAAAK